MNRKAVVLLVFLAVLCILPSNLSASYDASAIADDPKSTKDFTIAADTQDFVDTVSNLHTPSDIGTHSAFANMQAKDSVNDTLTEADTDGSTSASKLPTGNTAGTYPWTNPTNVYTEDTSYATATSTIPTFRSVGTMAHGTTGTFSPGLPSGYAANDILILYGTTYTGGTLSITAAGSVTWNAMTGSPVDVASGDKLYIWWGRYSSGSTAPTLQASADHGMGRILAFYNCYTGGTPIDVSATGTETTSDTSMSFATGLTTGYNNELVVCIFSTTYDPTSDTTSAFSAEANTNLASVTERSDNDINEGNGGGAGSCTGTLVVNGAVGTFTATYAQSSPKSYMAFALRSTVPDNARDHRWTTFGFSGYSGTITKVEVGYEAYASVNLQKLDLYTTWDGGSSWSSVHTTGTMGTSDPGSFTYIEVTSDTSWTWSNLANGYLEVKVTSNWESGTPVFYLDALIIRVTYNQINYELDLEVGWTSADYDEDNEYLCIFGGTQDAEALKVDVWAGSWTNVIADIVPGWNNISVSGYLTSSAFEIRFVDATKSSDTSQSAWAIDAVLLHIWSAVFENVSISQILSMSETPNTAESLSLVITEVLEASATPSLAVALVTSLLQIVGVAAAVSTQRAAVIMTFQAITIASVSSTAASMGITINELLSLTSSTAANILTGGLYSILVDEVIGTSSSISSIFSAVVGIAESLAFFDMVEAIINPPIILVLYALLPIGLSGIPEGGLEGVNIFYDLFFSANMWSYLGPMGLVIIGYFLAKKEKVLGVLWFVLECLFVAQYFTLVNANPAYWWHIFILLLGGLFTCVYPLWDR